MAITSGGQIINGKYYNPDSTQGSVDNLPTPQIPTTIDSSMVNPNPPIPNVPALPQDRSNYASTIAGATPYTAKTESAVSDVEKLLASISGKESYSQQQNTAQGVDTIQAEQDALANQIKAIQKQSADLQNQASSIPDVMQQDVLKRGITTTAGLAPLTASALRENSIKQRDLASQALTLSSTYDLNAGRLESAKRKAQQAVDLKYKDVETALDQKIRLIGLYSPFMTEEQKKIASDTAAKLEAKKTDLADKKKQQTDVVNAAQTNGDSATASAVLQLDPSSSTFTKDLAALQAKVAVKPQAPYITDENGQTVQYKKDANGAIIPSSRTVLGGKASGSGVSSTGVSEPIDPIADENLYQQLKNRSIQFSNLGTKSERERALRIFSAKGETIPRPLTAKELNAKNDAVSGLDAVQTLRKMSNEGKLPLARDYIFGDTVLGRASGISKFTNTVKEASDIKTRIRTGAALNESEIAFYASQTPRFGDSPSDITKKLDQLEGFYLGMSGLPVTVTNPKTGESFEYDDLFDNKQRLGLRESIKQGFTLSY